VTQMRWNFTLPDLEEKLNGLSEGGLLQISVQAISVFLEPITLLQLASATLARGMHALRAIRIPRFCFASSLYGLTTIIPE